MQIKKGVHSYLGVNKKVLGLTLDELFRKKKVSNLS
jgi:hypothetical protein